mmetsp:Transcript_2130/g.5570  ORF Transcript_2130/g.5570 Transcript_2130/m.5570 type:complete len:93 (-) Transcript_2130:332-610(-)
MKWTPKKWLERNKRENAENWYLTAQQREHWMEQRDYGMTYFWTCAESQFESMLDLGTNHVNACPKNHAHPENLCGKFFDKFHSSVKEWRPLF